MVSLLSEFRATLPFLQLRSGERDQNIINEVGAALLPRSGLVLKRKSDDHIIYVRKRQIADLQRRAHR
ncbi:MAG: hypothetical protein CBB95_15430 [Alteromonas sp. TMED35]|nr:MAG: hypothetical protein CBB95_15430 [Alteromonas sp. TMED35]